MIGIETPDSKQRTNFARLIQIEKSRADKSNLVKKLRNLNPLCYKEIVNNTKVKYKSGPV